jgi:hypothetical protein
MKNQFSFTSLSAADFDPQVPLTFLHSAFCHLHLTEAVPAELSPDPDPP